jgi:hypothetical protein
MKNVRSRILCLGLVAVASATLAAVAPGENLLLNGAFDAEQVDFPEFWTPGSAKAVFYERSGGPEGKRAAVVLRGGGARSSGASARQQGLTLVPGGTYKLSAYVRTSGFSSRNGGAIIHNSGWLNDVGLKNLPADSAWTCREKAGSFWRSRGLAPRRG